MEDIVALCRRRGFVFQSSEIYGGINGFWDYGPLGVLLKKNLKDAWWNDIITCPDDGPDGKPLDMVGLDATIIMNPKVWVASGHVGGFSDPMVDCRECKSRFRADHMDEYPCPLKPSKKAGGFEKCSLTEAREFNLMFETYVGAIRNEDAKAYLRPETAQGIFANFDNVVNTSRVKVPFGIAQIGKAFRNEVTPRNFTFRSREFEQMEIEFFIRPDSAEEWYKFWRDTRYAWWKAIGLAGDNLTLREHDRDELAHYAKEGAGTSDIEYRFPFTAPGFGELEGVAHRTDYDLRQHAEHSGLGDKLKYFDQERNERYFPHVIEPSAGADRGTLAVLCEAYTPTPERKGSKVVMKFHPRLAPIKAAVFPLVNKEGMPEVAEKLYRQLRKKYSIEFDVKQSIGKRYARMDEAGTPYCFTVDGDTLTDNTVTVRDRDTASQDRIAIDKVEAFLAEKIGG
ncbi:glycine--tRNA ligase [Phycisphaerales bacterium AB-hyl4]|uniref:glycine--tRNA ligase n=1 Tax=Natronomicrosphaera hydrolytica TaxID=3242702 RepID=A0ABV4U296_9BACT